MKNILSYRKNGFTLVELLVVVAVIGILSAALMTVINPIQQQKKARDSVRRGDLAKISSALEQYYADHNSYPTASSGSIPESDLSGYLKTIPTETNSDYRYCYDVTASGQDYVLCSISEAYDDNTSSLSGTPSPCSVLASGSGTEPNRYCIENPF